MARPRGISMLGLIVASFVLVSTPLLVAIVFAFTNVSGLSRQAESVLERGMQVSQLNLSLDKDLVELQRNVRQALIVGEVGAEQIQKAYGERQRLMEATIARLQGLFVQDGESLALLAELRDQSRGIAEPFVDGERDQQMLQDLVDLRGSAEAWVTRSTTLISDDASQLHQAAQATRELLTQLLFTAVPIALCLILIAVFLIARPLGQLSRAIRGLGTGGFEKPIKVGGPGDLEALGHDLDGLRLQLAQAEADKQQFLQHMSHELKTPLASLLEGTELFVDGSLGALENPQSEVAGILRSNAQELRHLIENLLDYSAWQANGSNLDISEFEFQILCSQVVDQYRLAMRAKNLTVDQRIIPMRVRADRGKLRTVITNLVSNAIKYSPADSTVHVRALRLNDNLIIDVADAGPNVPAEERHNIFQPFFTGTPPSQSHLRGSGIGLSLVQGYVSAHGGRIELVDGLYSGAHFRVTLPVCTSEKAPEPDEQAPEPRRLFGRRAKETRLSA